MCEALKDDGGWGEIRTHGEVIQHKNHQALLERIVEVSTKECPGYVGHHHHARKHKEGRGLRRDRANG